MKNFELQFIEIYNHRIIFSTIFYEKLVSTSLTPLPPSQLSREERDDSARWGGRGIYDAREVVPVGKLIQDQWHLISLGWFHESGLMDFGSICPGLC